MVSIASGGAVPTSGNTQGLAAQSWLPLPALSTLHSTPPVLTSQRGLILSPSADPIPHRLVQRIQSGEFVEMRDLLADNVSLHTQLENLHGQTTVASTPIPFRPRLREVPSLISWTYCFLAVRSGDPQTRDLLAYCRLLIREALRHGGNGWQEYDRSFRRPIRPCSGTRCSRASRQPPLLGLGDLPECIVTSAGSPIMLSPIAPLPRYNNPYYR